MKKSNHFANPFAAWSGHRLFHVVAGTLVGAMVVTQASAMLPTPEPALDNSPSALQSSAFNTNSSNSNAQAVNTKITASLISVDANGNEALVPVTADTRLQSGNILEYQGFRERFDHLIGSQPLDETNKLEILLSCVKGNAKLLLSGISINS